LIEIWTIHHPNEDIDIEDRHSIKVDKNDPVRNDDASSILELPPNLNSNPDYYWMGAP